VQGATVFAGYLFREEATRAAFVGGKPGGWFVTGDTGVCLPVVAGGDLEGMAAACRQRAGLSTEVAAPGGHLAPSCYKILGRSCIDIIKSGGYKLSALEIESALLEIPYICEAAVIGLEDEEWGQSVAAALVVALEEKDDVTLDRLRTDGKKLMAPYKLPKVRAKG